MKPTVTSFANAVYHRPDSYDFKMTVFSRLELKVLLMINGRRSVLYIARLLGTDATTLKPLFSRLVRLNLIQTEETIVSADGADLFFGEEESSEAALSPRRPIQFA